MRLKNTIIAIVVLLTSGRQPVLPRRATSETCKEAHRRVRRSTAGIASAATARKVTGQVKTQLGSIPSRAISRRLLLSAARLLGDFATDQNLYDAITRGFVNTSMPSWKPLTNQNRADLVAYVKTFPPSGKRHCGCIDLDSGRT